MARGYKVPYGTLKHKPVKLKIDKPDYSGFNKEIWEHHLKTWIEFVKKDQGKSSWLPIFLGGQKLTSHAKHVEYTTGLQALVAKENYKGILDKINGIVITDDNKSFIDQILAPMGKQALGQHNLSQGINPTYATKKVDGCTIL